MGELGGGVGVGCGGGGGEVGGGNILNISLIFLCEASGAPGPMVQGPLGP